MKKSFLTLLAAVTLMLSSCMTPGLGTTSTTNSSTDVLGSVLGAVLTNVLFGGMTYDQSGLLGNWNYNAPSTAFTTEKTLTQAGGNATVANMNSSLASNYNSIGINRSNTAAVQAVSKLAKSADGARVGFELTK